MTPRWLVSGHPTTLTELHSLVVLTHANAMMTNNARARLDRAIRAVDQAVLFDLQLCVSAYFEQTAAMARETLKQVTQRLAGQSGAAIGDALASPSPADARRGTGNIFVAAQRRAGDEPAAPPAAAAPNGAPPPPTPTPRDRRPASRTCRPREKRLTITPRRTILQSRAMMWFCALPSRDQSAS